MTMSIAIEPNPLCIRRRLPQLCRWNQIRLTRNAARHRQIVLRFQVPSDHKIQVPHRRIEFCVSENCFLLFLDPKARSWNDIYIYYMHMSTVNDKNRKWHIGIGSSIAATPSHTTVHADHADGGSAGQDRRSRPGRNRPSERK